MEGQQRPGVRRKSSASNLLNALPNSRSVSQQASPIAGLPNTASLAGGPVALNAVNSGPLASTTSLSNTSKDWETSSPILENPSSLSPSSTLPIPSTSSFESVRELISRRILSIAHIRQTYEGKSHWLNTVVIPQHDLERSYSSSAIKRRTWKFTILGISLASALDHSTSDLLRGVSQILSEYEQLPDQLPDEITRPKMRNLLKNRGAKKVQGGGGFDSYEEVGLAIHTNIPFTLDYYQVVVTFCDVLTELYIKIRNMLGSGTFIHSGMQHSVPPGTGYSIAVHTPNAANNPLYTLLFPEDPTAARPLPMNEAVSPSGAPFIPGAMNPPPAPTAAQSTVEMVLKCDGKVKKITNSMLKEIDSLARDAIRKELSSLNPLLQNMVFSPGPSDNFGILDFD